MAGSSLIDHYWQRASGGALEPCAQRLADIRVGALAQSASRELRLECTTRAVDHLKRIACEDLTSLTFGVRQDLANTARRIALQIEQGELKAELGAELNSLTELEAAAKSASRAAVAPWRERLRNHSLGSQELSGLLRSYVDDPRRRVFGYDEADYFFDELIGLEPRTYGSPPKCADAIHYQPTPISLIRLWCEEHQLSVNDTVYDIGCGLGRVVAAFKCLTPARVVGVEFFSEYANEAQSLLRNNSISGAEIVQADVRTADLEQGTLFYLFNPFEKGLLGEVVGRLEKIGRHKALRVVALGKCQEAFDSAKWLSCTSSLAGDMFQLATYENRPRF